jgi:hypothetical protein
LRAIDRVDFVKAVRQFGRIAQIVDRLSCALQSGGTAMNSVCIRRPAEFSGYSRLRSSASRSDGGSFSRISS